MIDNSKPLVSVLMTAYNREQYIADAIESVLASTYEYFELLIVDDCSTDSSLEIARGYAKTDNRIVVYANEENKGQFPNRNYAASLAKGKYIKYLDSDDIIYPHGLAVMVWAMEKYPEAGIGFTFNEFGDDSRLPILLSPLEAFRYHFTKAGLLYVGPSGEIFNADYFKSINGFANYGVASDYEFNLRAAASRSIVLFNRDLIWWRTHDGQEFEKGNKGVEYIVQNFLIHSNVLSKPPLDSVERGVLLHKIKKLLGRKMLSVALRFHFKTVLEIHEKTRLGWSYLFFSIFPNRIERLFKDYM